MTRFGWMVILVTGVLAVLIGLVVSSVGVTALRALFVGVNALTMLCYGCDKYLAQSGGRRVPEAVLHVLAAVGGTPGAFVSQMVFRHKTRDRQFRVVFYTIAAVQILVLLWISHLRGR